MGKVTTYRLSSGTHKTNQAISLPAACRTSRARFRFRISGNCIWELDNPGWFVDTVSLN